MAIGLEHIVSEIESAQPCAWQGRVSEVGRGALSVDGLSHIAGLGDLVDIHTATGGRISGEVLALQGDRAVVLPDGHIDGVQIGNVVRLVGEYKIAPDDSWLGKVLDPFGRAIGHDLVMTGPKARTLRGEHLLPTNRKGLGDRLETGMTLFNTILPIARGQRIGLFAGSGVGKSTLLAKFVLGVQADVVVLAMIGERSREVTEFVERVLGPAGMKRTVVVAATSDQSPLLRRRCAGAAMAVAEHFREQGLQVLLLADSLTRYAEAHREIALATGETAGYGGFPPSTASLLTSLCERAGPGPVDQGDITAIFTVLVAGSDMEEPVADILRGVLDGHVVLDREIAERGRFPAVDVLRSVSRALPNVASADENAVIAEARKRLGCYAKNELMIRSGLYTDGSNAEIDQAIAAFAKLDVFFAQNESENAEKSFEKLRACLE